MALFFCLCGETVLVSGYRDTAINYKIINIYYVICFCSLPRKKVSFLNTIYGIDHIVLILKKRHHTSNYFKTRTRG